MVTEKEVAERHERHKQDLDSWREPDGILVPTEPDPEERHMVRERLKVAIFTLEWVLSNGN